MSLRNCFEGSKGPVGDHHARGSHGDLQRGPNWPKRQTGERSGVGTCTHLLASRFDPRERAGLLSSPRACLQLVTLMPEAAVQYVLRCSGFQREKARHTVRKSVRHLIVQCPSINSSSNHLKRGIRNRRYFHVANHKDLKNGALFYSRYHF